MRGMIKWKPFSTLLTNNDIKEIAKSKLLTDKPNLMEDKINELNDIIKTSIHNNLEIEVKYWSINTLKLTIGKIEKINKIEKYILINRTRIYFKNIININIL